MAIETQRSLWGIPLFQRHVSMRNLQTVNAMQARVFITRLRPSSREDSLFWRGVIETRPMRAAPRYTGSFSSQAHKILDELIHSLRIRGVHAEHRALQLRRITRNSSAVPPNLHDLHSKSNDLHRLNLVPCPKDPVLLAEAG